MFREFFYLRRRDQHFQALLLGGGSAVLLWFAAVWSAWFVPLPGVSVLLLFQSLVLEVIHRHHHYFSAKDASIYYFCLLLKSVSGIISYFIVFTLLNSLIGSLCLLYLLYHCYNGYTSQVQNINKSIYTKWNKCIIWPILKFFYISLLESTFKSYPLLGSG